MKPTIDPTLRNWMYAREMCRRLGFTPDELFLEIFPSGVVENANTKERKDLGGPILSLTILRQGLRFGWTIGVTALPLAEIDPAFRKACASWNDHPDEWSLDEFRASAPMQHAENLIMSLRNKGFALEMSSSMFTGARPHN